MRQVFVFLGFWLPASLVAQVAPPTIPVLESFLERSWPGSRADALTLLAVAPDAPGKRIFPKASAVEWKVTSKHYVYQGVQRSSLGELRAGDYPVGELLAVSDQVQIQHLWISVDTRDPKAEEYFKTKLTARFGEPKSKRDSRKGAFPRTITTWVKNDPSSKHVIAYALEAVYATEGEYFVGGVPVKISLHTYEVGDMVSLFFDPYLFSMNEDELSERFTLLGLRYTPRSAVSFQGFFGMSGSATCYIVADRLQALHLSFGYGATPDTRARIVTPSSQDAFLEGMKELISVQARSYPSTALNIKANETPTVGLNSYQVGKQGNSTKVATTMATKNASSLPLGQQSFQNETKLAWSARSWEGNYLLAGKRLTAYPPGVDIAKVLNPAVGTLAGMTSVDRLFVDIPYVVTGLNFDRYSSKLLKHPKGGIFLEIPMIDQGHTNYCFPATMARILNYYGRNVEMKDVAKVAGSDVLLGTNTPGVFAALERAAAKLEVYPVLPRGASAQSFGAFIQESINLGQPILWLATVDGTGHARVINGYDAQHGQVIFTDSWGKGHEADRMPFAEALAITLHYAGFAPKEIQVSVPAR